MTERSTNSVLLKVLLFVLSLMLVAVTIFAFQKASDAERLSIQLKETLVTYEKKLVMQEKMSTIMAEKAIRMEAELVLAKDSIIMLKSEK